jgi:hypothetical protein
MSNKRLGLGKVALLSAALMGGLTGIVSAEENKKAPIVLDNVDYASHRNVPAIDGRCYEGQIFNYDLLSDATFSETDKKGVRIRPIYFYDIDGDGKFGKAEKEAIKKGIPIFMHPAFNDLANAEVREFLERATEYSSLSEQLKQGKKLSPKEKGDYEAQLAQCRERICQLEKQLSGKEVPEASPEMQRPKSEYELKEPQIPQEKYQESGKQNAQNLPLELSLILQEGSNFDFNTFETSAGLRFGNEKFALGVLVDASIGLDKRIETYSSPLSAGRTAYGTVDNTNRFSVGLSAEAMWSHLVFGAGIDYSNLVKKTVEQINDKNGNTLKSNINSEPDRQVFGKAYVGAEIPITDSWKLGAIFGYNGRDGTYLGLRTVFRLNQPQKGK